MKKKYFNFPIGSIFKGGAWFVGIILFITGVSAVFKACNENSIRDDENERAKIELEKTQYNQKVYLKGGEWEKFYPLKKGESNVPVPYRIFVEIGEAEDSDVEIHFKNPKGVWQKYIPNGEFQQMQNGRELPIRASKDTRVWLHFFYFKKDEAYVKQKYLSKKY